MMMVVNMTRGKLEEFDVFNLMNDGSLAIIGAKMEKKPKFMAWLMTVADNCQHCSSVYVSNLISLMPILISSWMIWLITNVKITSIIVSTTGWVPVFTNRLYIQIDKLIDKPALTISNTTVNNEDSILRTIRKL